jgi:hypothetical protein
MVISAGATAKAQLSDPVQQQMAEILAFKQTFTPDEQKMSSNLVLLSRQARNMPLGSLASMINTGTANADGKVGVEIGADLSPALMSSAVMTDILNGTDLPGDAYAQGKVHAQIDPSQLLALAANPDVKYINDADIGTTNVGSVTSQGYVTHTANKAYSIGIGGAGINIGVLSDSASAARVAALISSGDLPPNVTVLPGQASSGNDEGTAMMEIIHDLAPGANLFFATANGGQANFANNIRTLRFVYHCDIIVDDVTYFAEGAFQDGTVAKAVNDVVGDGALYFSAAANSGNLTFGTAGTWEGDFLNGGIASALINNAEGAPVLVHNFGTVGLPKLFNVLKTSGSGISLKWSDPLAGATDDYDLFVLNSTGTAIKGVSFAAQTGTQDRIAVLRRRVATALQPGTRSWRCCTPAAREPFGWTCIAAQSPSRPRVRPSDTMRVRTRCRWRQPSGTVARRARSPSRARPTRSNRSVRTVHERSSLIRMERRLRPATCCSRRTVEQRCRSRTQRQQTVSRPGHRASYRSSEPRRRLRTQRQSQLW